MKEWFKARNLWGSVISGLTDEDAGKFVKALWKYTMTGEKETLDGMLEGIFLMVTATLESDDAEAKKISEKRAIAGSAGGNQRIANQANEANASSEANEANASIKNKNKNKNKEIEKEIEIKRESNKRFTPPTIEEVSEYCKSRNNGVDPEQFVAFYSSKGWKVGNTPMKDWKQCIITWEKRDRQNQSSQPQRAKTVTAQQYAQRDYSSEQDEALKRMLNLQEGA